MPRPAPDSRHSRIGYAISLVVILAGIVVGQATLVARIHILGVTPNLLLTVVSCWALVRGIASGMAWGFVGGLVFDLVAGLPLGTSSLGLMSVCFLTGLGENNFFQGNIFLPAIIVSLATPLYGGIVLLSLQTHGVAVDWPGTALTVIGPELLLNVATVVAVYPLMRWLSLRLGGERISW